MPVKRQNKQLRDKTVKPRPAKQVSQIQGWDNIHNNSSSVDMLVNIQQNVIADTSSQALQRYSSIEAKM